MHIKLPRRRDRRSEGLFGALAGLFGGGSDARRLGLAEGYRLFVVGQPKGRGRGRPVNVHQRPEAENLVGHAVEEKLAGHGHRRPGPEKDLGVAAGQAPPQEDEREDVQGQKANEADEAALGQDVYEDLVGGGVGLPKDGRRSVRIFRDQLRRRAGDGPGAASQDGMLPEDGEALRPLGFAKLVAEVALSLAHLHKAAHDGRIPHGGEGGQAYKEQSRELGLPAEGPPVDQEDQRRQESSGDEADARAVDPQGRVGGYEGRQKKGRPKRLAFPQGQGQGADHYRRELPQDGPQLDDAQMGLGPKADDAPAGLLEGQQGADDEAGGVELGGQAPQAGELAQGQPGQGQCSQQQGQVAGAGQAHEGLGPGQGGQDVDSQEEGQRLQPQAGDGGSGLEEPPTAKDQVEKPPKKKQPEREVDQAPGENPEERHGAQRERADLGSIKIYEIPQDSAFI